MDRKPPINFETKRSIFSSNTIPVSSFKSKNMILPAILIVLANIHGIQANVRCEIARVNCALRNSCGSSLHNYMIECTDLIAGRTNRCHHRCERALIGLIGSNEGKELINCDCDGNKYCMQSKSRIEVCRQPVSQAVAQDTIVSCSMARWICISDQLCKTALEYYQLYCHALFQGHKCTHRCNNSLSILDRQEKAAKLRTCYCDGTENFPCHRVKYNTERYCYGRHPPSNEWDDNIISPIQHRNHQQYHQYRISSSMALGTSNTGSIPSVPRWFTWIFFTSLLFVLR